MLTAIDLDQLAIMLAAQTRLVEAPPLFAGQPKAVCDHPSAQRLSTYSEVMLIEQNFRCQSRPEVGIVSSDQLNRIPSNTRVQSSVRFAASRFMYQRAAPSGFILRQ